MDLMGCMERCANPDYRQQEKISHEQCRYGCMRKGISCSTNCISEIEAPPTPDPVFNQIDNMLEQTTSTLLTQPVQVTTQTVQEPVEEEEESVEELCLKHYDILPMKLKVFTLIDEYAPFDMRVKGHKTINLVGH